MVTALSSAATVTTKAATTTTTCPSLTCVATLSPPVKQVGEGAHALVYRESQPAWQCTFSPNGQYLAACFGCPDACVRIWKRKRKINAMSMSGNQEQGQKNDNDNDPDDDEWVLQSTLQGIQLRTIRSLAFAPIISPMTLASASFDGTIAIWELANPSQNNDQQWSCIAQLEGHDNEVKCVTWNATGTLLATCGRDKTVWLWEAFLAGTIGGSDSNDGGSEFECLAVLNGHAGDVKCVRFCASHDQWGDGDEILLSASYDDTIRVWAEDAGDWYCAASIAGVHTATIWALAVAPSGGRFLSGSTDGSLAIYKCYTAEEKRELFPDESSSNGRRGNGMWKCVGTLPQAHRLTIYSVDYASTQCGHGRIVSGSADNCIHIYREASNSTTDQPQFVLEASVVTDHGDVNCVCWHPYDGSFLASAGDDGNVRLWKYRSEHIK